MIFRGKEKPKSVPPEARDRLAEIVERYLADVDDSTRRIVTAVAGLLAAWGDAHIGQPRMQRHELSPMPGSHVRFHLTGDKLASN